MAIILNGTSGIITPGITNTGPFIFEGPVTVPAGTASSPSVSFTGSTNTGLYLSSTGAVSISTAGTQRVVVSASGDVGIGTNTPATKLAINGGVQILAGNALNFQNAAADANGTISNSGGSGANNLSFNSGAMLLDASGDFALGRTPSAGGASNYRLFEIGVNGCGSIYSGSGQTLLCTNVAWDVGTAKYMQSSVNAMQYSQENGQHIWKTAGTGTAGNTISFTQAMTLDASGNLGVGTSSPTAKLHVWQTGAATSLNIDGIENPIFAARYAANADGATIFLAKSRNATVGSQTIVQNGDELGVLKARGSNGSSFVDAAAIFFNVDGTPGSGSDMPGRIVFGTSADGTASITERARITSYGVSIGTASVKTPLTVVANNSSNGTGSLHSLCGWFARGTSNDAVNILSVTGQANNSGTAIYARLVATGAVNNESAVIEFWASISRVSGGANSTTAIAPAISKAIVGSAISAGSLAWSGTTLQYTPSTTINYVGYTMEIQVTNIDGATITLFP